MSRLNATHDPTRKSWVDSANAPDCPFPIQNLPFGVFSTSTTPARIGVAIGDRILDLGAGPVASRLPVTEPVFSVPTLNGFMSLGPTAWTETREALSDLLCADAGPLPDAVLIPQDDATMHLPFDIAGYTDFYASREHATNVGTMFRGAENALMPNWLHIPIGYNGRASTVVVSGTEVRRPLGQLKSPDAEAPAFGPSRKLDIELEIGAVVGTSSAMGEPVHVARAEEMIFGYVLLNDWSARDIQVWEYQPLGPFQSKAFATTISPWVVTRDALAPFKTDGPAQVPTPLPYLRQDGPRNYDIDLTVTLRPGGSDVETEICRTNFRHMYWSSVQQLAHHASSGCAMRVGDLLGSGTISGPDPGSFGSLLESTWNGRDPIALRDGGQRTFIEDGDTLTLHGFSQGDGYRIGFGTATGTIRPALDFP